MKIIVSRNELMAASLFASTDESRYVLNGICVEAKKGMKPKIITTDGRRLCVIESQAEQAEIFDRDHTFVLRADFVKPLCALAKAFGGKLFPWICIENNPGSLQVTAEIVGGDCFLDVHKNALVEGEYPKWRDVVPPRNRSERVPITDLGINSEFVGDFAKAAKMLESKTAVVQMSVSGEDKAIEVKLSGVDNFYGLIMPCRADDSVEYQPEFLGIISQLPEPESEQPAENTVEETQRHEKGVVEAAKGLVDFCKKHGATVEITTGTEQTSDA